MLAVPQDTMCAPGGSSDEVLRTCYQVALGLLFLLLLTSSSLLLLLTSSSLFLLLNSSSLLLLSSFLLFFSSSLLDTANMGGVLLYPNPPRALSSTLLK